jgi:spore maturation protein CgeB
LELRKLRQINPLRLATWRRALYSARDLARGSVESTADPGVELLHFPYPGSRPKPRPLRVLFAAPKFDYGDPRRGLGIEENYFLHTLVAMGHQVVRFDSLGLVRRRGRRIANELLRETVDRHRPDLLLAIMFKGEFEAETLDGLKTALNGRTIGWFCDDQWRFDSYTRHWAPHFGWPVTTSHQAVERYRAAGIGNVLVSQWGCNHFLYRPLPLDKKYDVSFVGQPHGDRPQVIQALQRAGIGVHVWGFGWPNGRVSQTQFIRIISMSRINLNLSNASVGGTDQLKGRDFEVPGCRGFLITKKTEDLARYYEIGREVETYESTDELVAKIRHYLKAEAERERISEAGYQRTMANHTMEIRLTELFQSVLEAAPDS